MQGEQTIELEGIEHQLRRYLDGDQIIPLLVHGEVFDNNKLKMAPCEASCVILVAEAPEEMGIRQRVSGAPHEKGIHRSQLLRRSKVLNSSI